MGVTGGADLRGCDARREFNGLVRQREGEKETG